MEVCVEACNIDWRVEIDITRHAYPSTRDMPGEGADFDIVAVYVDATSIDVWPKLNAKTRRAIEQHPDLQRAANEAEA